MTVTAIDEHSDNIAPEAGLMLIAEGNAYGRDVDLYYEVKPAGHHPWLDDEHLRTWRDYLAARPRSAASMREALRLVRRFVAYHVDVANGDFIETDSEYAGSFRSIFELSVPQFAVAPGEGGMVLTLTSGVFAWDGFLMRPGDVLTFASGGGDVVWPAGGASPMVLPMARCVVSQHKYSTYNADPPSEMRRVLGDDVLDVLDPDGTIRRGMVEAEDAEGRGEYAPMFGVKYYCVQAISPPQAAGPVVLAEIDIGGWREPSGWLKYRDFDGFLTILTDASRPIGYAMLERFKGEESETVEDPWEDLYARAFKLTPEYIASVPRLGTCMLDNLDAAIRGVEEHLGLRPVVRPEVADAVRPVKVRVCDTGNFILAEDLLEALGREITEGVAERPKCLQVLVSNQDAIRAIRGNAHTLEGSPAASEGVSEEISRLIDAAGYTMFIVRSKPVGELLFRIAGADVGLTTRFIESTLDELMN